MKKTILIVGAVVLLIAIYYFVNSSNETQELSDGLNQQQSSSDILNSEDFVWSAVRLQEGPNGGSDFISTSELTLSVNREAYVINDYITDDIYGCREVDDEYRDGILEQYDESYTPDFFTGFMSYYLCPSMGGGNLFVVDETEDEYAVEHYMYGDGLPAFTLTNAKTILTILKL